MKTFVKNILLILFIFFITTSCSVKENEDSLKIATNSWIGYTPLFYAKEKGYLNDINIELITTVSLGEAADIFSVGRSDMVTTTQHEYNYLKKIFPSLVPIILLDRSNGGDMILSNKGLKELKNEDKIYAYLEIDSVNSEILKNFISNNSIDESKLIYINKDQAQIKDIELSSNKTIIAVTYTPYDIYLKAKGFKEIASTKDLNSIIVIDSICSTKEIIDKNLIRMKKLKKIIDKSINEIQNDTYESYKLVATYLENISYDEYLESLKTIKWINKPSKKTLEHIKKIGYKEENFI
jgi:NitT/TauT family transport system substrate-binding protein